MSMQEIYGNAKSPKAIKKALEKAGLIVEDLSEESGYFNLHIPFDGGHYRVYKAHDGKIKEQVWRPVELKWSGIPTFEPSGRKSF